MSEDIEVTYVSRVLHRRWRSILLGLVSVLAAVAVLTRYWPRSYQAEATFLVEQRSRGGDAPALEVLKRLGRGNSIETEIELLQSRRILEPVVDSLDLHVMVGGKSGARPAREVFTDFTAESGVAPGTYRFTRDGTGLWVLRRDSAGAVLGRFRSGEKVAAAGFAFTAPSDASLGGTITVAPISQSVRRVQRRVGAQLLHREADLILLTCKGRTPRLAHDLCRATASSYIDLRRKLQRSEATSTAAFLRTQVARVGQQLAVSEDSLREFKRAAGAVVLSEQASAQVRDVATLIAQREQMEAERSALADLLAKVDAKAGSDQRFQELASFPTLFKNSAITSLMQSLVELQNRRADLALRRQDRNADLAAVDARIGEIQRQLHETASSYESSLATQVRALDRALASRQVQMAGLPEQQVESERRERQVALLAELHRSLELRLREAEVGEAVDLPSVQIADSASMPNAPSSPNPKVNLALGVILGLGFGLGIAVMRENRDTRIYEWRQLEQLTNVPLLSIIPHVDRAGPLLETKLLPESIPRQIGAGIVFSRGSNGNGVKRGAPRQSVAALRQRGEAALALEVFRGLGTDLSYIGRNVERGLLSSVAITSAGPGEGKTFTACNLALARAAIGTRTLLLDCDLRESGVSAFFGLPRRGAGLIDVLEGSVTFADARHELQLHGDHTLSVLTAGAVPSDAGQILESHRFTAFMREVTNDFSLVVVDTPPVNILTDASIVARVVDGVLVVVRKGVTDQRELDLVLQRLRRIGHPAVGMVFGAVPMPEPYRRYMEPVV